jgi:mannose-P-dolichol utilization defect protein 1
MSSALLSKLGTFLFQARSDACLPPLLSLSLPSFLSEGCLKPLVSAAAGSGILLLSTTVKLPTIRNIVSAKSAEGISMTSSYLDVILYSNACFYGLLMGFPLTAFGETLSQLMQCLVVVFVVWT